METINFRSEIKTLLEKKGISIAKLSRMVDLNSGTLYKYLRGLSEITVGNLTKLFNALNSIEGKGKE